MAMMVDTAWAMAVSTGATTARGVPTLRLSPTMDTSEAMAAMAMVDTAWAMVVSTGATTARGALRPSPTMAMAASMALLTTATPPSLPPPLSTSPVPPPPPSLPASVAMPVLAAMSLTLPEPSISPRGRQRLIPTTMEDMVDTDMAVDMAMAAMAMAVDISGVRQGYPTSSPKTPMAFCLLFRIGQIFLRQSGTHVRLL